MSIANIITLARICLVPVFVFVLFNIDSAPYLDLAAALVFSLVSLTDFLDGYLARKYNQITDFGKFLDPLADKILVSSAIIILVGLGRFNSVAAVIIVAREFIVTSIRLVASSEGRVIAASMSGKLKTVSQITAVMAVLLEKYWNMVFPFSYGEFFVWAAVALTVYSGAEYLAKNWRLIRYDK
jgi:CDP-diacylglycerol--glycerol-3-phosphate 3-phosphatidyltransferase